MEQIEHLLGTFRGSILAQDLPGGEGPGQEGAAAFQVVGVAGIVRAGQVSDGQGQVIAVGSVGLPFVGVLHFRLGQVQKPVKTDAIGHLQSKNEQEGNKEGQHAVPPGFQAPPLQPVPQGIGQTVAQKRGGNDCQEKEGIDPVRSKE